MPRLPLHLGQLGALCWLASSSLAACEEDTRRGSSSQAAPPAPGDRLRLVQVVFRHGARTPLTDKFWPEANARWEKGTLCGELLPSKLDIAITNGANGGPQPFSRHDARQVKRHPAPHAGLLPSAARSCAGPQAAAARTIKLLPATLHGMLCTVCGLHW